MTFICPHDGRRTAYVAAPQIGLHHASLLSEEIVQFLKQSVLINGLKQVVYGIESHYGQYALLIAVSCLEHNGDLSRFRVIFKHCEDLRPVGYGHLIIK